MCEGGPENRRAPDELGRFTRLASSSRAGKSFGPQRILGSSRSNTKLVLAA